MLLLYFMCKLFALHLYCFIGYIYRKTVLIYFCNKVQWFKVQECVTLFTVSRRTVGMSLCGNHNTFVSPLNYILFCP